MAVYDVYQSTLVYAAFYAKRTLQPHGSLSLTTDEYYAYVDLFNKAILEANKKAKDPNYIRYNLITEGEPQKKYNLKSSKIRRDLAECVYTLDAKGVAHTDASSESLSLKSVYALPQILTFFLTPPGYEEAFVTGSEPGRDD